MSSIDNTWSAYLPDLKHYNPEIIALFIYILVKIDNFSKFVWPVPLKNICRKTITDEFSNNTIKSKRKPTLIDINDAKEFANKKLTEFLKRNIIKRFSGYTDQGAVFAEGFNRTSRDLLKNHFSKKALLIGLVN